jgi:hypothetical protein
MVKAINFKNWCTENISPQAWNRIILRTLPELRTHGFELASMENPDEGLELNDAIVEILNKALDSLYQLKVESEILS